MGNRNIEFIKMDGTGNDFVIIDSRSHAIELSAEDIKKIADRKNAITKGCDQVIIIEKSNRADCFMRIYNSDGSEVSSCGNATRCVGQIVSAEKNNKNVKIETAAGLLDVLAESPDAITVNMGKARLNWNEIPLSREMDTLHIDIKDGSLSDATAISMGNPHAVFFVDNVDEIDFLKDGLGSRLEHHELFPERANIGVAEIIDSETIKLRVFERGAGETASCGTGACAAVVAAARRGLVGWNTRVKLRGGDLNIEWKPGGNVFMTGSVRHQFKGTLDL